MLKEVFYMLNKKNITICCIIFIVLIIISFRDNIIRFKLSTRLNYHENVDYISISIYDDILAKGLIDDSEIIINDMECIKIYDKESIDIEFIEIHDKEDIEKMIKFLNSLELIEDNPTEYEPFDRENIGFFDIALFRNNGNKNSVGYDWIVFHTNYMEFVPEGHDSEGTRYFIKNSGYNSKTKSSKTFAFLYDLLHESK